MNRGAGIHRPIVGLRGLETNAKRRPLGRFVEAVTETAHDAQHADVAGGGELELKRHGAFDAGTSRFVGVLRRGFEDDLDRPIEKPVPQRPVETGLFERTNSARTNQADAAVTTGAFGNAAPAQRGVASGAVTTGGFGSVAPAARKTTSGEAQTAGFDRANAAVQPAAAVAAKPVDRPVEIVFKPTPEYTDEARSARVEGTVSLELEFTAGGDVRVLRVVRGLGHGLDEAAQRAAVRIRFKPAQSDGRPVDSRATVHITFRLS